MRKWLRIFKNEWMVIFLASSLMIFISFIPFFYQVAVTPSDRIFLGTHNNLLDYPMFIGDIKQARKGRLTFYVQYTSEEQKPTLVHYPYLLLGFLGRVFNLDDIGAYHIGRVVFGLLLAVSYYYFICQVFKEKTKRLGAFLLTVFSGGFIKWALNTDGERVLTTYLTWWTGGDVVRRLTFQPHGMFKTVLLLFSVSFLGKYIKGEGRKYYFLALFLVPFLGLLDPGVGVPAVLFLLWGYLIFRVIVDFGRGKKVLIIIRFLLPFLIYSFAFLPFVFYMKWVFEKTPWKSITDFERKWHQLIFWKEYTGQFGVTFFTGVIGAVFLILNKRRSVFTWFNLGLVIPTLVLILTSLSHKLGFYNLRFFGIPMHLFMGIASVAFFWQIGEFIAKKRGLGLAAVKKNLMIMVFLAIIPSVPSYFVSIKNQMKEFHTNAFNVYTTRSFWRAAKWMEENIPFNKVVLSNDLIGQIIPATSGNRVYIGHVVSTLNYDEKKNLMVRFFSGEMGKKEAERFIKEGNIDYIIAAWGEEGRIERAYGEMIVKIYDNEEVGIYKVRLTDR